MYEDATENLRKILLPVEFVGMIDGLNIYVQEKYKIDFDGYYYGNDYNPSSSISARKKISTKISVETQTGLSIAFVEFLIQSYGIKDTVSILEEIEDLNIYDLHGGNYGFARDNRCIIFDYAGYSDNYYYE